MKKINIRRIYYRFSHEYFTLNNAVITVAFIIAANWVWGSLGAMQRNFSLQKELDDKSHQLIVAQLDTANAKLAQRYYRTDEYKELAVRERLGLVAPGERVLVLLPNSDAVLTADRAVVTTAKAKTVPISNFGQWMNFLFGGNIKKLSK